MPKSLSNNISKDMVLIPRDVWEAERKMRFFGADANQIYKKKFNIFIGISISNKKLTSKMALNYLKWALRNTKSKVAVVIADELNIVNYEILDKYSKGKAKNRAKKVGEKFELMFKKVSDKLPKKERAKINIYRWDKIKQSKNYSKVKSFLEDSYSRDSEFKSAVTYFINKYMRKKGKVVKEPKKVDKLATYILGELPTLLQGIKIDRTYYQLCIYPTYFASGMSQFVMDMHAKELKVGEKLKKLLISKAILVEAWLD